MHAPSFQNCRTQSKLIDTIKRSASDDYCIVKNKSTLNMESIIFKIMDAGIGVKMVLVLASLTGPTKMSVVSAHSASRSIQ